MITDLNDFDGFGLRVALIPNTIVTALPYLDLRQMFDKSLRVICAICALSWAAPNAAWGSGLELLSSFRNTNGGAYAQGDLVAGRSGALFGTTVAGGTFGSGTVFKLVPPDASHPGWRRQILYSFNPNTVGDGPNGGALLIDDHGALYGAISIQMNGNGEVFKLSPPAPGTTRWSFSTLYAFTGKSDGDEPNMSLIRDTASNLYGTTQAGGNHNLGVVYELSPPSKGQTAWTQTVIYAFTTLLDSGDSFTGVVFDKTGNLIGTTSQGGYFGDTTCEYGCGEIFRLIPPASGQYSWTKQTLHVFTGGTDGEEPESGVILDRNGVIYGTTAYGGLAGGCPGKAGCGTVFSLTPNGSTFVETILHAFQPAPDGAFPIGHLIFDAAGNLLGTTAVGGVSGQGTIFRLIAGGGTWDETVLFDFANAAAAQPWSSLLPNGLGGYYGTTSNGPAGSTCYGCGAAFEFTP